MKLFSFFLPAILIFFNPVNLFGEDISNAKSGTDELIKELILSEQPSNDLLENLSLLPADELMDEIMNFNDFPELEERGKLIRHMHPINDTLNAPYYVYTPKSYDPLISTPLMIWLHGGVSRKAFPEDLIEYFDEHFLKEKAEEEGWIVLFPMGKLNATWWDKTGMDNIIWQINKLRQTHNIDDDQIAMAGFSDGGSGSFHFAFLQPDNFAMFFPWSGRPDVGTQVSGTEVFIPNLRSGNIYAVNGGRDGLYPAAKLIPLMKYMIDEADVELSFTVYDTARHDWGYIAHESQFMVDKMRTVRRDLYTSRLYWECSDVQFGRNRWLEVMKLDTLSEKADWHRDFNFTMIEDRITIGFMADQSWEGEGVRVESLSNSDNSPAIQMKLKPGDLVIGMDGNHIASMGDLVDAKSKTKRGNSMVIKVNRKGKILELKADVPAAVEYEAFPHPRKSAAVKATRVGNNFYVNTSRVGEFAIYLHPNMVKLDQPIRLELNGKELDEHQIKPNSAVLLEGFIRDKDRKKLWVDKIVVKLDPEPH